jgi:hypothetical protein
MRKEEGGRQRRGRGEGGGRRGGLVAREANDDGLVALLPWPCSREEGEGGEGRRDERRRRGEGRRDWRERRGRRRRDEGGTFVAAMPSITGILISITINLILLFLYKFMAWIPFSASRHFKF